MKKVDNKEYNLEDKIIEVYFPRFEDKSSLKKAVNLKNDSNAILNKECIDHADTLFPINPLTGDIDSDISRLLSNSISPLEKERIMANLIKMPSSKRKNLSDDELIQMLPSRRNSTLTDIDAVRDYFESEFLSKIQDGSEREHEVDNQGGQESK